MYLTCKVHPASVENNDFHHTLRFAREFRKLFHNLVCLEDIDRIKDTRLLKVLDYIQNNYQKNISQSDAAQHAGFTPSTLSRVIRQQTFRTFTEILNEVRIAHTVKLIWETDEPLECVAFDCGFGTGRTFTREFRQHTGFTPSDFRVICNKLSRIDMDGNTTHFLRYDEIGGYRQAGNEINHYRSAAIGY